MAIKKIKPRVRPPSRPKRPVKPGSTLIVTPPPAHVVPPRRQPRPTRPLPTPTPATPDIPVPDVPMPSAARSTEQLVRDAKVLGAALANTFYQLGLVLRELSRPERYTKLGYDTFAALPEGRDITTQASANKVLRIVDAFAPDAAEKLGVERAYAVIRYADIARPGEKPLAVLRSDPVLRLHAKTARLATATVKEIFEAIRRLRRTDVAESYLKRVHRASRGISQRLEHIDIRTARVRSVQRGSRVLVRVEIEGIEAEKLLAILKRA